MIFKSLQNKYLLLAILVSVVIFGIILLTPKIPSIKRESSILAHLKSQCEIHEAGTYNDDKFGFSFVIPSQNIACVLRDEITHRYEILIWNKELFESDNPQALDVMIAGKISIDTPPIGQTKILRSTAEWIARQRVVVQEIIPLECSESECPTAKIAKLHSENHEYFLEEYSDDASIFQTFHFKEIEPLPLKSTTENKTQQHAPPNTYCNDTELSCMITFDDLGVSITVPPLLYMRASRSGILDVGERFSLQLHNQEPKFRSLLNATSIDFALGVGEGDEYTLTAPSFNLDSDKGIRSAIEILEESYDTIYYPQVIDFNDRKIILFYRIIDHYGGRYFTANLIVPNPGREFTNIHFPIELANTSLVNPDLEPKFDVSDIDSLIEKHYNYLTGEIKTLSEMIEFLEN